MTIKYLTQQKSVFKYRSFGSEGSSIRMYAQRLVEKGEIYFALPSTFNDIYEGLPSLSKNILYPFRSSQSINFGRFSLDFSNASFPIDGNYLIRKGFEEEVLRYFDSKFGIFCASNSNKSIQQWAYYGDNHFGFCVEIKIDDRLKGYEISYVDKRPNYNLFDFINKGTILKNTELEIMLTKHLGWSHENEIRFISEPSAVLDVSKLISCIFLGARSGEEEEGLIRKWLSKSDNKHIPIKKMSPHCNKFEITDNIVPSSYSINMGFPGDYFYGNKS